MGLRHKEIGRIVTLKNENVIFPTRKGFLLSADSQQKCKAAAMVFFRENVLVSSRELQHWKIWTTRFPRPCAVSENADLSFIPCILQVPFLLLLRTVKIAQQQQQQQYQSMNKTKKATTETGKSKGKPKVIYILELCFRIWWKWISKKYYYGNAFNELFQRSFFVMFVIIVSPAWIEWFHLSSFIRQLPTVGL